ncbi:MAG: hypothetical protein PWR10_533 [Halanaerobiales bacterium]|nr:hypothetical protein [Halanaerobiales bacterium]
MIYYIYDGSFEGLLTAIYEAFYHDVKPDMILKRSDYQENLFAERVEIVTERNKSDRVYNAVREKISSRSLRKIYYAFLSEIKGVETRIYHYLQLGFKIGRKIDGHLTDDTVLELNRISNKVGLERHRLLGLIRFRRLDNDIYYAPIEPDYNIIALLAPHFSKRLADQNWVIHDLKRKVAAVYNREEWVLTGFSGQPGSYAEDEAIYQSLWKDFFKNIAITNRKNSRLQLQFMPVRYWKHLIEKETT